MTSIETLGKSCCGCHGCEQICPSGAIKFVEDTEGFVYPQVNESCIECGKCEAVCPIISGPRRYTADKGFAAFLKDKSALNRSSSGGVFAAAAKTILECGGMVIGCGEAVVGHPKHIVVTNEEDLKLLQGSKYVQSDISGMYTQIEDQLKTGRLVLFSGTPCQVAGLRKYVGEHDNLYTVDLICHGVPSRKMYKSYLKWLEKKTGAQVEHFRFRSKDKHDWSLTYQVLFREGEKVKKQEKIATLSPYYHQFLCGMTYRESCYTCGFACPERCGDLTIGDFWGIEQVMPEFYNLNGVSAVLVNSPQGCQLWSAMQEKLMTKEVPVHQIVAHNGQLNHPTKRPTERNAIYECLNQKGYDTVAKIFIDPKMKRIDTIKDFVPNRIRQTIKLALKSKNWWSNRESFCKFLCKEPDSVK